MQTGNNIKRHYAAQKDLCRHGFNIKGLTMAKLYFYYSAAKENAVKPFVDYILSDTGQQIVKEVGYVPLQK